MKCAKTYDARAEKSDSAIVAGKPTNPVAVERLWLTERKSEGARMRTRHHDVPIAKEDDGVQRLAEAGGTRDNHV